MRYLFALLLALPTASFADGPGSRIRLGPDAPQPAGPAAERDLQRCEAMRGEVKERCMRELRRAIRADDRAPPHAGPGPEATGMGSGAGRGASSGPEATGMGSGAGSGASTGSAAPR